MILFIFGDIQRMQNVTFSPYDFTKKVVFIGKMEKDTSVLPPGHKALVDNGVVSFDIATKICEVSLHKKL